MKSSKSQVSRLETLRNTYDAGYFHGANSGYPKEGYGVHHPDWTPWLKRIGSLLDPGDRWLDLGCAYGFLVEQARKEGHHVVGCDISRFALNQNVALAGFLAEADALALPFKSGSLKLITAFDVLEHLEDPLQTIREIHRCLSTDGLIILATPDPCRFPRKEPTHFHESPPARWFSLFENNGFSCNFGFEGADFNLVLAAAKSQSRVAQFHKLLVENDLLETIQASRTSVTVRVRTGFHSNAEGWVLGEKNEIYLFNPSEFPVCVSLKFSARTTGHNGALLLIADGRVIERLDFLSTSPTFLCRTENVLFASGGHSLQIQLSDGSDAGQIIVGSIKLQVMPATHQELVTTLPFDLFERYYLTALLWQGLSDQPGTILDFGGYMGDQGGHWGDASNFGLPALFTDLRPADSPRYLPETALIGKRFEMVLALDVLEHIPPSDRRAFLEKLNELSNKYLVIAGPFASAETEAAENRVRESLVEAGVDSHTFLSEHSQNGLPARDEILRWISEKSYSFCEIEGMSLHMWEILQKTSLALAHYQQYRTLEQLNRSVNLKSLWPSNGAPYRRFFLISKHEKLNDPLQWLPRAAEPTALLAFLQNQPEMLSARTARERNDSLFLLNETQKHIRLLENQVQLLENQTQFLLNEHQKHVQLLENHARELEKLLQAERQKPLARIAWRRLRNRLGVKHD